MKNICKLSIVFFLLAIVAVSAQVPQIISYQGILTDTSGIKAATPGSYIIKFSLYIDPKISNNVWEEEQTVVVFNGGYFQVELGSINPLSLDFNKDYFLGIKVQSGPSVIIEFTDRIHLTASPYALNTYRINGKPVTGVPYKDQILTFDGTNWINKDFLICGKSVDTKTPSSNQVLKYDGQKWTPQEDATGGTSNLPTMVGDSGIVITTGTNTIKITGVNIKANSPLDITSSNGILTINLNKVPLSKIENGNAQKGQTLKWNGTEWSPAFDMPIGTVVAFAGEDVQLPDGWLYCDGSHLNRTDYTALYDIIGWTYGKPNSQQFDLPDYRGIFLRGIDTSYAQKSTSGRDPDRYSRTDPTNATPIGNRVGSIQGDTIKLHDHLVGRQQASLSITGGGFQVAGMSNGSSPSIYTQDNAGEAKDPLINRASETRPKNAYVNWIIKAK
jgi:microcystin-dependent protein